MIDKLNLKSVKVIFSYQEAKEKKLKIDHNDDLAYKQNKSFGLLIHGTQKAKTFASKSLYHLRALGWTGYSAKNKNNINLMS